jgi:acetoin utilization deacetylase AcuC-like enzyme
MTFLGLAALGGLSVWVAVVIGRGISGARFNRALRAYVSPIDATPESVVVPAGLDRHARTRPMAWAAGVERR